MKRPKFVNTYRLKHELCDVEGVTIDALKVGDSYEVTHQEREVTDSEGNVVMTVIFIEVNGFESQLLPASFADFFEEVKDGEEL